MQNLFLIRGLPASGKSTLAKMLAILIFEADMFFMQDGKYVFDGSKLPEAHAWCQDSVRNALASGEQNVVVANTFTTRWELEPYIKMANDADAKLIVVDLFDGGCDDQKLFERNSHNVPLEAIAAMRSRYEHDWRNGNPLPPWDRN